MADLIEVTPAQLRLIADMVYKVERVIRVDSYEEKAR